MSKVDDELTRRLRRAERPVDGDGVFEELARRRSRHERVRRVQGGMLALAVLAATAGGFLLLHDAFDPDARDVGVSPSPEGSPANGEIVFSRSLPDGSEHLFAVQPGVVGERLITSGSAIYADPSVAPDGRTIAVVHSIPSFADMNAEGVIATFTMDGGEPTWITDPLPRVSDLSWSPDGTQIAFAGIETGEPPSGIFVINADGSSLRLVVAIDGLDLSAPDWSPDGQKLVFAGLAGTTSEAEPKYSDLFIVGIDGSGLTNLTESPAINESTPSWSPAGDLIAYRRNEGNTSDSIQLIDTSGRPAGTFFDGADDGEIGEVDWSPDGRLIAFTSSLAATDADTDGDLDVWTTSVDGTQLVLANLTTDGASGISWQPLPSGSGPEPSISPEPSVSPSAELEGRDIGLGFNLCQLERLGGIDWYGDGTLGSAWTGARTTDGGRCPSDGDGEYVVAADLDGDGIAEPGGMGFRKHCLLCRPFAATDLSGDGVLELVVLEEASSTPSYSIYEVSVPTSERSPGIYALFVAPPGHPEANLPANAPIRFIVGGDEGFSGGLRCENYPAAPVLVYTWFLGEVDADTDLQGHETRVALRDDGIFHVLDTRDFTIGRDEPTNISTAPACGVDFHPNA
jgi:hypothetical protein